MENICVNNKSWDDYPNLLSTTPFNYDVFMKLCPLESRIIDIGCGYGRICKRLENLGYHNIVGLDTSKVQLDRAQKALNFTQLFLINENEAFNFLNASFNCLITLGVIDCITDLDKINFFINECTRIIDDNGYWFINFYTRNDSEYFDLKYKNGWDEFRSKRVFLAKSGIKFKHYSLLEFITLIDSCFDVIKCDLIEFLSFNQINKVKGYSIILKKIKYKSKFR